MASARARMHLRTIAILWAILLPLGGLGRHLRHGHRYVLTGWRPPLHRVYLRGRARPFLAARGRGRRGLGGCVDVFLPISSLVA